MAKKSRKSNKSNKKNRNEENVVHNMFDHSDWHPLDEVSKK
jgi:hypothetical protein